MKNETVEFIDDLKIYTYDNLPNNYNITLMDGYYWSCNDKQLLRKYKRKGNAYRHLLSLVS